MVRSSRNVLVLGLLLLASASCGRGRPRPEGKNVLLLTLDTTRADYVSPLGADPRITPHLEALASRSCLFTSAVSETNVTNPSHLSIMTGLRAIEHGVVNNRARVPESLDTLAEAMRRAGYRTAGFPAVPHVGSGMGWRGFDLLPEVASVIEAREITDRAAAWLRNNAGDPFFLWAHYFEPHTLYEPPADVAARFYQGDREAGDGPPIVTEDYFLKRTKGGASVRAWLGNTRDPEYARAMYAAEIHTADREIGRLLAELEGAGLAGNTVVVVVADHGEGLGEHGIFYAHLGLYEEQLRIPLIVHVPGLEPSRSAALVSTLDVAPTIGELTGVRLRHAPSGLSLVPLLRGEDSSRLTARSTLVHQHAHNNAVALRQENWKLIWTVATDWFLSRPPELYDLRHDPGELVNLAAAEPERVEAMRRRLEPWIGLGRVGRGQALHLNAETLEQLRALGYVD